MTTYARTIATGLVACSTLLAFGEAAAQADLDTCRAGYKTLLMTPGECRAYVRELRAAQARGDHMAVLDLQEWHTSLLIERSQACPCISEPAPMRDPRRLSSSETGQASSRY